METFSFSFLSINQHLFNFYWAQRIDFEQSKFNFRRKIIIIFNLRWYAERSIMRLATILILKKKHIYSKAENLMIKTFLFGGKYKIEIKITDKKNDSHKSSYSIEFYSISKRRV